MGQFIRSYRFVDGRVIETSFHVFSRLVRGRFGSADDAQTIIRDWVKIDERPCTDRKIIDQFVKEER